MFTAQFWVVLLIVLISIILFILAGVIVYYKITNQYKNGFVGRVHMPDKTIRNYRYNTLPADNRFSVTELNSQGEENSFTYVIREKCIEKGTWGHYSDYDYHVSEPLDPEDRAENSLFKRIKELLMLVGAMLDTDLYVKLMRNSKFEEFMRKMAVLTLVFSILATIFSGTMLIKSFIVKPAETGTCELTLSNQTWQTIYVATHISPPSVGTNPVPQR